MNYELLFSDQIYSRVIQMLNLLVMKFDFGEHKYNSTELKMVSSNINPTPYCLRSKKNKWGIKDKNKFCVNFDFHWN